MEELPIATSVEAPGTHLCGLAWDGRALWHSDGTTNLIYRIEPDSGKIIDEIGCPTVRTDLAYVNQALWQIAKKPKQLVKIDCETGAIIETLPLGDRADLACGLAITSECYWVGRKEVGHIEAKSMSDNEVRATYCVPDSVDGIAVVGETIWYTSYRNRLLGGIEMETGDEVIRYQVAGKPTGMCFDGQSFWYSDYKNNRLNSVSIDDVEQYK